MENFIKKIIGDKKEYRLQMTRVAALPEGYQFVFEKIQSYLWSFSGGSGMDMLKTQYALIDLFESGATEGRHVLDIIGEDVASFCNELMQDNKLWTNGIRDRLNHQVSNKLKKLS